MTLLRLRSLAVLAVAATVTLSACGKSEQAVVDPAVDGDASVEVTPEAEAEAGSDAAAAGSPDAAEVEAGKYSNEFFGFTMAFPDAWTIASQETTDGLQDTGAEMLAGDDEALKSSIEAAEKDTYQLLMISEQPVGAPTTDFNPNLVVMAEKVSHLPGIKSGSEYLENVSNLLLQTDLPYAAEGEPYEVEIGGRKFHRADFTLSTAGIEIKQSYLATVDKGYALGFILSGTDDTMSSLDDITQSISF
ncbi:MAG: hypothetical protein AAF152_15970 [Cyanobacteria bacterium P01_A01_bin.114]